MDAGNATALCVPCSGATQLYHQLKERLTYCLEAVSVLESVSAEDCEELKARLATNTFNLVVVGQFKRGKTCLINALLGVELLPVAVVPLTSIVTILTYGETLDISVIYNNGETAAIGREELTTYVTEIGNPRNIKGLREVVVHYPSAYLKEGVRLIDTPGVGSIYRHNTDVAYQYLPKCDAALFLLSVEQPASQAELDFLRDVRQYADRIFFLLNKIDYLSDQELDQSVAFSRQVIQEVMGPSVKIFPISAKLALDGQLAESPAALEKSRLPGFSEILHQFLVQEKGKILLASVIGHLHRLVSQARCRLELELKALTTSLDELKDNIAAINRKRRELLGNQGDLAVLLDSEISKLIRRELDSELDRFKEELAEQMELGIATWRQDNLRLPLAELNSALESYIAEEVQQAFQNWRLQIQDKLAVGFEDICRRFTKSINDSIDTMMKFSSELFGISFDPIQVEPVWSADSNFFYRSKNEPVALELLVDSVTVMLPRLFGERFKKIKDYLINFANRMIFGKAHEHMLQMIDMQCGRIRHDFIERLNKSKNSFYNDIMNKLDVTVAGLNSALDRGLEQKTQGEGQVAGRRGILDRELQQLDLAYQELLDIRHVVLGLGEGTSITQASGISTRRSI
jgi:small GTP-binding protein